MFFKRFLALLNTRNKEFIRDRSSLGWNIIMPVLIVVGFAFAFSGDVGQQFKVGVINMDDATAVSKKFLDLKHIEFYRVKDKDKDKAIIKIQRHQVDLLLDAKTQDYWVNEESPSGYMVEKILRSEGQQDFHARKVTGKQIRYLDWVVPGILSMNMMFSALFGVGFVIVRYRKNGMLKRLKATPITAFEYLAAQVVSRMILIMAVTAFVFYGTGLFIDFAMYGSHISLFIIFALGALSMISLGLLVAARISSEETAGGLLNLFSWPMMFFSGVWFSLEGTSPVVQAIAQVFPLTHVTAAARSIMVDGASLFDQGYHILVLSGQSIVFLALGSWLFKWDSSS